MKFLGFVIAFSIVLVLGYCGFSFIQSDWNTLNWHWVTRAFFVLFVLLGLVTTINNTYGKIK